MPLIETIKATLGMILEKDIIDKNGRVLVKSGTILEEKHLKAFRVWRISQFYVQSTENMTGEKVPSTEKIQDMKKYEFLVKPRFKFTTQDNIFIQKLYEYCLKEQSENKS